MGPAAPFRHTAQAEVPQAGSLGAVCAAVRLSGAGVVALGAAGVVMTVHEHIAQRGRRLEAVADLKVGQITRWLDEGGPTRWPPRQADIPLKSARRVCAARIPDPGQS